MEGSLRLEDCDLSIDKVVVSPPIRRTPDNDWSRSFEANRVPKAVYRFYCSADYFSIDRVPRFFQPENGKLFFYLASLLRGIREIFDESYELVDQIKEHRENAYSPIKRLKEQEYDERAAIMEGRCFKYLLVNLASSLDQLAEVVALFLPDEVPDLIVGRASFTRLANWLKKPIGRIEGIVSPTAHYCEKLHTVLSEQIEGHGPEQDWLDLFFLYRNKFAHLGDAIFPKYGLADKNGKYHSFIPRQWPISIEEHIRPARINGKDDKKPIREFIEETVIHIDLVEYSRKLLKKIDNLLNVGFEVLCKCYNDFKDFEPNTRALEHLNQNSKKYSFSHFQNL